MSMILHLSESVDDTPARLNVCGATMPLSSEIDIEETVGVGREAENIENVEIPPAPEEQAVVAMEYDPFWKFLTFLLLN